MTSCICSAAKQGEMWPYYIDNILHMTEIRVFPTSLMYGYGREKEDNLASYLFSFAAE